VRHCHGKSISLFPQRSVIASYIRRKGRGYFKASPENGISTVLLRHEYSIACGKEIKMRQYFIMAATQSKKYILSDNSADELS
jgi:hypothetical protein